MLAVIFELEPIAERRQEYLDFASLSQPGKLLSLSFWRDEAAISAWRNLEVHRAAQRAGREGIFSDYRLRVASVIRDYGLQQRDQAPNDSQNHHR